MKSWRTFMETQSWAEQECAYADLGDPAKKDWSNWLNNVALNPMLPYLNHVKILLQQKLHIASTKILLSHRKRYCPHQNYSNTHEPRINSPCCDTTQLDYSSHPATEGPGTLQTKNQHGLIMHTSCYAITSATWDHQPADMASSWIRQKAST